MSQTMDYGTGRLSLDWILVSRPRALVFFGEQLQARRHRIVGASCSNGLRPMLDAAHSRLINRTARPTIIAPSATVARIEGKSSLMGTSVKSVTPLGLWEGLYFLIMAS